MFLLARPSIGEDPPQRGLGDDVLDPVRAKELPQWSQPRAVDKQHRLAQIAHSIEFHESCVMVGFPVRRDRVPVDEPTDAGALCNKLLESTSHVTMYPSRARLVSRRALRTDLRAGI